MKIFTLKQELSEYLNLRKKEGKVIGFAPTMGALHQGHISLIDIAKKQSDAVICSIFVNPTQFTDPKDLERYPRTAEADIAKLKQAKCDVLFMPDVAEMYSENELWQISLGYLETILEGEFRPGHYQGVTQVVKKLFDAVRPDKAFFGQKDYQQVLVIKKLIEIHHMPVEIIMCPILRETDGLAMSSRNIHLSEKERNQALAISRALQLTAANAPSKSINELKAEGETYLKKSEGINLEYFEIRNARTLEPADTAAKEGLVVLVAAKAGNTRLIDNVLLP